MSYRISDILEYAPFASDFAKMIGRNNVQILNEIKNLHLHDFGVYIDLEPDEEQRQLLEQNIQQSISAKVIELDDAIDIRSIRNITLANTLLKIRKQRKQKMDMQLQKRNIDMQTQSNVQSTQAASKTRMQESQMDMKSATQLEQLKAQIRMQEMEKKAEIDKELLETKYMFEIKLKEAEVQSVRGRDMEKEDRKDKRTEKQATQQSAMIDQRKAESGPKDFERKAAPQGLGMSDLMGGNLPL